MSGRDGSEEPQKYQGKFEEQLIFHAKDLGHKFPLFFVSETGKVYTECSVWLDENGEIVLYDNCKKRYFTSLAALRSGYTNDVETWARFMVIRPGDNLPIAQMASIASVLGVDPKAE